MREFVPATQLSTEVVRSVEVQPVRELVPTDALKDRARELSNRIAGRCGDMLTRFSEGLAVEGMEGLIPLLHEELPTPARLLGNGAWVVLTQARRTADRARQAFEEASALAEASEWPGPPVLSTLDEAVAGRTRLDLSEFAEGVDLRLQGWGTAAGNASELAQRIT